MVSAIVTLIVAGRSHAEPYLAVREGLQCSACHVNRTGQGMRTAYGVEYAETILTMITPPDSLPLMRQASQEFTIGVDFRIQNHTNFKRDQVDPPRHLNANSFLIDEAKIYGQVTLVSNLLTFYISEQIAPQPTGSREIAGIISGLPWNGYLKAGQMYLPYGLRVWDRDSFILSRTGILESDFGFEVGMEKGAFSLNTAVMNADPLVARDINTAKQVAARLTYASRHFWGGGSFNFNGKAQVMGGGFFGFSYGPVTILHETDILRLDRGFLPVKATQIISYGELNILIKKGFNFKAAVDYYDPDGVPDPGLIVADKQTRFRFGIEPFITPFFQTRLFYTLNRRKIRISDCDIQTGDDCIVLLGDSRDVNITNCKFTTTETALMISGVRNLTFSNCTIHDAGCGIGFRVWNDIVVDGVRIDNIVMDVSDKFDTGGIFYRERGLAKSIRTLR